MKETKDLTDQEWRKCMNQLVISEVMSDWSEQWKIARLLWLHWCARKKHISLRMIREQLSSIPDVHRLIGETFNALNQKTAKAQDNETARLLANIETIISTVGAIQIRQGTQNRFAVSFRRTWENGFNLECCSTTIVSALKLFLEQFRRHISSGALYGNSEQTTKTTAS